MKPLAHASTLILLGSVTLSGCLTDSFSQEVRQTRLQIESLNQRVGRLEGLRAGSGPTAGYAVDTASVSRDEADETTQSASGSSFQAGSAFGKLTRGLVNILTGWVEIPKRIHETSQRSGAFAGFTWGLLRGIGYGFIRTAGGIYETVTFPAAAPPGYRPMMQPEFVFISDAS